MRYALLGLLVIAAGCGATRTTVRTVTVERAPSSADQRFYGHIVAIDRSPAGGWLLRFDPAFFLSGVAANVQQALVQGQTCKPLACPPVPNDNLALDETHGTITFLLPAATRGTVLESGDNLNGSPVSADELAAIVNGTSPAMLFEPLDSGVWLTVHIDTVTAFQQQYRP